MAITKEQFEIAVKQKYDNLTKQDFGLLMNSTKAKLSDLMQSKDIVIEKHKDDDDYNITHASNEFYERVFGVFKVVSTTRRLSFKQYKCLAAFINAKVTKEEDSEYKQF
jgi:hypothetical protein